MRNRFIALVLSLVLVACGAGGKRSANGEAVGPLDITTEAQNNQANADAIKKAEGEAAERQALLAATDAQVAQISLGNYNGKDRAAALKRLEDLRAERARLVAELADLQNTIKKLKALYAQQAEQARSLRETVAQKQAALRAKEDLLKRLEGENAARTAQAPTPAAPATRLSQPQTLPPAMPNQLPARVAAAPAARPAAQPVAARVAPIPLPADAARHFRQDPSKPAAATSPQPRVAADDQQFIKDFEGLIPLVICHADYVLNEKFILFFGHGSGEMVITCRQGIGNEGFTALAKSDDIEVGLGWKNLTEEGSLELFDVGIDNRAVWGMSAMLKASAGSAGNGGSVGAGVNIAKPLKAGFILSRAKITRGGGAALTLQLQIWQPACGNMEMLNAAGHNTKALETPCK